MRPHSFDDFILVCDQVLPQALCEQLIRLFRKDERVQAGQVVDHLGRKSASLDKVSEDLVMAPEGVWQAPYKAVHDAVTTFVSAYAEHSPALQVAPLQWPAYKIQRYPRDKGYFTWHFDALGPGAFDRVLGLIIYLNDVKVGGETQFYHQKKQITPVAGRGLLFPAAWTHMHCGVMPTSNSKFIISSFVSFSLAEPGI